MSDNSDRIEHCRVAGELSSSLILTGGLRTKVAEPIANLALQGWGIRLGFLTEWGIRVGLLFDRYGGHKERWFWFGIFSDAPIPAALLGKLPERWAVRITYRQKDKADDGFVHLKRPLMTSLVGRTIHEAYGPEDHWLGLYSPPGRAAFLHECIDFAADISGVLASLPADTTWEGTPRLQEHIRYERDSKVAAKCRARAECFACGNDFKRLYGETLSASVFQAHHKYQLSRGGERVTSQRHLECLCANCHRIVHAMGGDPDASTRLRDILEKH